jgi:hypothetical protein
MVLKMKKTVAIAFFVILFLSALPIIMKSNNIAAGADELSLTIINPGPDGYPAKWNASTIVRDLGTSNFIFYSNETSVSSTFFVNVTIQNVELMKGWGIGLVYDATILEYLSAWRPTDHVFKPVEDMGWMIIAPPPVIDSVNETHKILKWGCTYIMGETVWSFNGSGTLCQIQFKIIKEVNIRNPQAIAYLTFDPGWTAVYYHPSGQEVPPFTPAYFEYSWPIPPTPLLKIEPPSYTAYTLNEIFNISITINNLDAEWELIAIQFALYYNTTIFEFVHWQNGTFLNDFVNNGESILYFHFGDFHGDPSLPYCYNKILVGEVILPDGDGVYHEPFPSGSGVIGTITLKVIAEPPVSTQLTLNEIQLFSEYSVEIPCNVEHAEFNFPFEDYTPPTIRTPTQNPPTDNVPENQPVTITVNVTDVESGVKNVTLYYTNNTEWYSVPMEFNDATELWEATIPGHALGTQVKYKIEAYDIAGNRAVNDNDGEYYVYTVIPEFPSIVMVILLIAATMITLMVSKNFKNGKSRN